MPRSSLGTARLCSILDWIDAYQIAHDFISAKPVYPDVCILRDSLADLPHCGRDGLFSIPTVNTRSGRRLGRPSRASLQTGLVYVEH
jgi:hypothetical protein